MSKEAYEELAPEYQDVLNQAVDEAPVEMRQTLLEIDETNRKVLEDNGITIITYEDEFFDEVLALDSVQRLYSDIDASVGGIGSILQENLETESK